VRNGRHHKVNQPPHAADLCRSARKAEEVGVRIIYDERRDTNPCFLVTGLAWGGMVAISATAYLQNVLGVSPAQRVVPEASTEIWAAFWEAAGLAGGAFLIVGLLLRAVVTRIAADDSGIYLLRVWGGDRSLFLWADVRSWRVESYQEESYDSDGQGGISTLTRLVVELESTAKPLVVEHAWQTAVAAELSTVVPMRRVGP